MNEEDFEKSLSTISQEDNALINEMLHDAEMQEATSMFIKDKH